MSWYIHFGKGAGPQVGTVAPCSGFRTITFDLTIQYRISPGGQLGEEEERYENRMHLMIISCSRFS